MEPDFSGYATKTSIRCADGRTILPKAFEHMDGVQVPLVWQHDHKDMTKVLGHAILEARPDGIYAKGYFNNTPSGLNAKALVVHKDISKMSIWANDLVERSKQVVHGVIREVSLVLNGANPKAVIDYVRIAHSDDPSDDQVLEDEAIIKHMIDFDMVVDDEVEFAHDGRTVQDVIDTMNSEQLDVLSWAVAQTLQQNASAEHFDNTGEGDLEHQEGTNDVTRSNVFEQNGTPAGGQGTILSHDDLRTIAANTFSEGGTFKKALAHALEEKGLTLQHGITNIDILFPDARSLTDRPTFISRRMEWVAGVINGTSKTPFSRVKTVWGDITQDEARALGYIKGTYKKEEWFSVTKRTTGPTTIIKKQNLDRDDIIDVEDFDLVAWMRAEMRVMIEEEIARAILIGDGRAVDDPDHIKDPMAATSGDGIRSIYNEHEVFATTVNVNIADSNSSYMEIIEAVVRSRKYYKGSGSPTFYTTNQHMVEMLLLKDEANSNRRLYNTKADLAAALMVKEIVEVEVMETIPSLVGIIVNLRDYNIGASKGGELTNFDDFDIDYNQYKYLIETRLSGALTLPFSAQIIKTTVVANLVTPTIPSFVRTTGVVTIPAQTGVVYKDASNNTLSAGAQTALAAGASIEVHATPASTYFFPNSVSDGPWTFKRPAA